MLLGLTFRGVAFEFRFKATGKYRRIWDDAFHFGSLVAAFMQGVIIGAIAVQGIKVEGRSFAGGALDWLDAYSVMTGVAVVFGYALLGGTWLVMKTDGETQDWARKCASYVIGYVAVFLAIVSISMPIMNAEIRTLWFSLPNFFFLFAHTGRQFGPADHHLARSACGQRIPPLFTELRGISDGLSRHRDQHVAVYRTLRDYLPPGGGCTGIPVPAAGRHDHHAAAGSGLHRLLLLHLQGQSIP